MWRRVAVRVAVADEEVDVLADALGHERGFGEARRHREEVDDASVPRGEHGACLGVADVDARERDVGFPASRRAEDGSAQRQRLARASAPTTTSQASPSEARSAAARASASTPTMKAPAPPLRRASIAQSTPLLPPAPSTTTTEPGRTSRAT